MYRTFLKVKEVMKTYNIGRDTIYNAIHCGELRAYKPNRRDFLIKISELEEWIQSKPVN